MELLIVLRGLVRRRVAIGVGALLALAAGVLASGLLGVGPFDGAQRTTWTAASQAQVDPPRPLAADALSSAATIQTQATLLADRLAADTASAAVARRAGLSRRQLAVGVVETEAPFRPSPLVTAAHAAADARTADYTLTATPSDVSPLITFVAAGPRQQIAGALARAAVAEMQAVAARLAPSADRRLAVHQLGPVVLEATESGGVGDARGAAVFVLVFVSWCCGLVVLPGLGRVLRPTAAQGAAAAR